MRAHSLKTTTGGSATLGRGRGYGGEWFNDRISSVKSAGSYTKLYDDVDPGLPVVSRRRLKAI